MRHAIGFSVALCAFLAAVQIVQAAPMRPMPTVTVTGTVVEAKWTPEHTKKGMPGASGSLGHDRKFPARFQVRLKDVEVEIVDINQGGFPSGKQASYRLTINSNDKELLKPGMKIKVSNYHMGGDEGGTWVKHDPVEILSKPAEKK